MSGRWRRGLAAGVAAVLLLPALNSCTPSPASGSTATWEQVRAEGWPDGAQVAVSMSTHSMPSGLSEAGYLAFIDGDGGVEYVETAPGYATLASDGETLCAPTSRGSYLLSGSSGRRATQRRSFYNLWTGIGADASCLSALDVGLHRADVYVDAPGGRTHRCRVPAGLYTGAVGNVGSSVLVAELQNSRIPGRFALHRCDKGSRRAEQVMTWETWQGAPTRYPGVRAWPTRAGSRLVPYDGRWYFLELVQARGRDHRLRDVTPGVSELWRLAELDPVTGRYRSTYLGSAALPLGDSAHDGGSWIATAATGPGGGYAHDGHLYTIDDDHRILDVDLSARRLTRLGSLRADADRSSEAVVAGSGHTLWVLMRLSEERFVLDRYDLRRGDFVDRTDVDGLADMLGSGELAMVSMAALD